MPVKLSLSSVIVLRSSLNHGECGGGLSTSFLMRGDIQFTTTNLRGKQKTKMELGELKVGFKPPKFRHNLTA